MARLEILYSNSMQLRQLRKLLQKHGDVILAVAVVVDGEADRHRIARLKQHYGLATLAVIHLPEQQAPGEGGE